jgi:hypothetical protein
MLFSVSVALRGLDLNLFAKNFQGEVSQRIVEETANLVFEIRRQWLSDLSFLSDSVVEADLEGFLEYALCNYLGNLARKHLSEWVFEG